MVVEPLENQNRTRRIIGAGTVQHFTHRQRGDSPSCRGARGPYGAGDVDNGTDVLALIDAGDHHIREVAQAVLIDRPRQAIRGIPIDSLGCTARTGLRLGRGYLTGCRLATGTASIVSAWQNLCPSPAIFCMERQGRGTNWVMSPAPNAARISLAVLAAFSAGVATCWGSACSRSPMLARGAPDAGKTNIGGGTGGFRTSGGQAGGAGGGFAGGGGSQTTTATGPGATGGLALTGFGGALSAGGSPGSSTWDPYHHPDAGAGPQGCVTWGGQYVDGICVFDCTSPGACAENVTCPSGVACQVNCGDSSCGGNMDCTVAKSCDIHCEGNKSCNAYINCGGDNCNVECSGSDSCKLDIHSEAPSTKIVCAGANSCGSGSNCGGQECTVQCSGDGSCRHPAAGATNTVLTCSGRSSCSDLINCGGFGVTCHVACSGDQSCAAGIWCTATWLDMSCTGAGSCAGGISCSEGACI